MALDIAIAPAMSTHVERAFSSSGILISDLQNRLDDSVIEAIELIKSWEKDGFSLEVDGTHTTLEQVDSLIEELLATSATEIGKTQEDEEWVDVVE